VNGYPKDNMHKWENNNLQKHYLKHPSGECKECWSIALRTTQQPIPITEYEIQSLEVLKRKWVFFTARFSEKEGEMAKIHQYYVDENLIVTISLVDTLKTSYKFHYSQDYHDNEINFTKKLDILKRFKSKESYSQKRMFDFNVRYLKTDSLSQEEKDVLKKASQAFTQKTRSYTQQYI
jgi:hypothetical protein